MRALVLIILVCAPAVFVYVFYKNMDYEFPRNDPVGGKIASACKLVANRDIVRLLNSIENLDWEKMLIPIAPATRSTGPCDVHIFQVHVDGNRTAIPGNYVQIEYIRYLDYVTTINVNDVYSGKLCFSQDKCKFIHTEHRITEPINECAFVMLRSDGTRSRLRCFIPPIMAKVDVCDGNEKRYFPANDTGHVNHVMSNPMFHIDAMFGKLKYRYYRRWRDDGYVECVNHKAVFRQCNQSSDPEKLFVYNGNGKCVETSRIEYACDKEKYTSGRYYIKRTDTEFIDCHKNTIVKCTNGQVYPTKSWNMSQCISQDSSAN